MEFAPEHIEEIIAHAREVAPHECCGLIAGTNGGSARVIRMRNAAASALKFEVDGLEVQRALDSLDGEGLDVAAVYHSHTRTAPYPSQTDVTFAQGWGPETLWVIVGLDREQEPTVRTYRIDGPDITEL
jgi:proteasome lid subunit RPN8/RPN11